MTLAVVFLRAARLAFDAAALWYEERTRGLGAQFVAEIDHAVQLAQMTSCPLRRGGANALRQAGRHPAERLPKRSLNGNDPCAGGEAAADSDCCRAQAGVATT